MSDATKALGTAATGLAEALRMSANDPADQIRLLTALAEFDPTIPATSAPIGAAIAAVSSAMGDLCRRAALISLARASAAYQPSSYDDAVAIRTAICALIDCEATRAADAGEAQTWQSCRALSIAVATDLDTRAAQLPRIVTIQTKAPLPALVLAYRLYRDATRAPDLIQRADAPAPLFMTTEFQALSS